MTHPETCGAAGGAISLWVKAINCLGVNGIFSSFSDGSTGFIMDCVSDTLRYDCSFTQEKLTSYGLRLH